MYLLIDICFNFNIRDKNYKLFKKMTKARFLCFQKYIKNFEIL